jgi:pimeloyl-ACP methyl ester carboxylesterase
MARQSKSSLLDRRGLDTRDRLRDELPRKRAGQGPRAPAGFRNSSARSTLQTLVSRYDRTTFEPQGGRARIRLVVLGANAWDALLDGGKARLAPAEGDADAILSADSQTWTAIAEDIRRGMVAHGSGRLAVRRNLHLGVGFLAATSGQAEPGRLRFRTLDTRGACLSTLEAGTGPPVVALHGLGGTKGSFLPTVAALAPSFRVIAVDLPGFGDSDKPIGAAYDARFFARAVIDLLDALQLDRVHLIGNSLGGRVALEAGLRYPDRVGSLALLAPSLAWRRGRPLAPFIRLVRPELGLVQVAPRGLVKAIVHRLIPGADEGWTAAGVDEFLRAYLTPAGRAAFYAAARQIYLEEPHGEDGFWPRLRGLQADALFVWGRRDRLVPIAFARHVAEALPQARHLELDCGHVPQVERPGPTHDAIREFLIKTSKARGAASQGERSGGPSAKPEPADAKTMRSRPSAKQSAKQSVNPRAKQSVNPRRRSTSPRAA